MSYHISTEKVALILHLLVEGNSLRGTARLAQVALNTVYAVLDRAAQACGRFHDKTVRNLRLESIQCDEIWGFVYVKARNVPTAKSPPEGAGDVWVWIAFDRRTKLIVAWHVGSRGSDDAETFMRNLAARLDCRVQLTTDMHRSYMEAVTTTFGDAVDYAQSGKSKTKDPDDMTEFIEVVKHVMIGDPKEHLISTSHVERMNLTIRMSNRRMIRRTNGFSKRFWRHAAMMALLVTYYNFCRKHRTLKTTPAVAAGLDTKAHCRRWLAEMMEFCRRPESRRGPYRRSREIPVEGHGTDSARQRSGKGRSRALRDDMACPHCDSHWLPRNGRTASGKKLYRCGDCKYQFSV